MQGEFSWLPVLLQTSDALFPTGAYAHSLGFEESVRLRLSQDEEDLRTYILNQIVPAQREQELPYLRFAYEAAIREDFEELCAIDEEISAWKLARETREASRQLGTRRLAALREIWGSEMSGKLEKATKFGLGIGHHLTACALQASLERVPLRAASLAFYYLSLSSICGAAMKLMRIGQNGCQRVLRDGVRLAEETVCESMEVARNRAGWFNPLLEIASMRHERAEERLFIS